MRKEKKEKTNTVKYKFPFYDKKVHFIVSWKKHYSELFYFSLFLSHFEKCELDIYTILHIENGKQLMIFDLIMYLT